MDTPDFSPSALNAKPVDAKTDAPVQKPDAPMSREDKIGEAIQKWMGENIYDGPVARNTEAFNHLVSALPALKAAILKGD